MVPSLDRNEDAWTLLGQRLDSAWTEWNVHACRNLEDSQTSESSNNLYDVTACRNLGDSQTPESSKAYIPNALSCLAWAEMGWLGHNLDRAWIVLGQNRM